MARKASCIFCEGSLKGSGREHVIPDWVLKKLSIGNLPIQLGRIDVDGEYEAVRSHTLDDLRLGGHVCNRCNHGWMSNLEKAVAPALWPLIDGHRISLKGFSDQERQLLAVWIAKTAFVLNAIMPSNIRVPHEHHRSLHAGQLPPGTLTLVGFSRVPHHYHLFSCSSWPIMRADDDQSDLSDTIGRSYKIVIQLGWIVLCIAFWADVGWSYAGFDEFHEPVWPKGEGFIHLGAPAPLPAILPLTYFKEMVESLAVIRDGVSLDEPVKYSGQVIKGRVAKES
jgi:hypothetical protein